MDSSEEEKKDISAADGSGSDASRADSPQAAHGSLPSTVEPPRGAEEGREESQPGHVDELIIPYKAKGLRTIEECTVVKSGILWGKSATTAFERGTLFLDCTYVEGLPVLSYPWNRDASRESEETKEDNASCTFIPAPMSPSQSSQEKGNGKRQSRGEEKGVLGFVPRRYSDSDSDDESSEGGYTAEAKGMGSRRERDQDSAKDNRDELDRRCTRFESSTDSSDSDSKRWSQRDRSFTPPTRYVDRRGYDTYHSESKPVSRYSDVKY